MFEWYDMYLTAQQRQYVLQHLHTTSAANTTAHAKVWSRRVYAPMCILQPELRSLREAIHETFPEYVIAFDVIFESKGPMVDWHCDYESLGPFAVPDRHKASRESHFMTVHINLTPAGGALQTLGHWPRLSYLHFWCISTFGIFSWMHAVLTWFSRPLFVLFGITHCDVPGMANVFDNTRLHAVTRGAPRTSYVVRLAHRKKVLLTRESITTGMRRSSACFVFSRLLPSFESPETTMTAGSVRWEDLKRP